MSSLAAAEARAADAVANGKNDRADVAFKAEFDRLRTDLSVSLSSLERTLPNSRSYCSQKAENDLGEAEQLVERQSKMLEDLTRKVRLSPLPPPHPPASVLPIGALYLKMR